ncbi:MAG: energy-coupling factor transporter ATPase [Oscillospiraceae bacterium]|nr:energy-coupling factor transporter ATPase [Oscillospiraceae bacterium]
MNGGIGLPTAVSVEHLSYSYPGVDNTPGVAVFEDLSLTVEQGSFVAVLGGNGCGKSTLAKHFNAILLPCGGKVYVCGMDTSDEEKIIPIRRSMGMVFQNPDNQIVANVVEEDVAFGPENLGVASPMIRQRVDRALQQVGMFEYRSHAPHLLSGGQKQRVAIAGIIAMEPKCIVLDEPTAMLDPKGRREVMETVLKLNREKGITVILITHHMDEAAQADRVVVLSKGQVVSDGTPREVFSHVELLHSIRLAAPETVELCKALNDEGFRLPLDRLDTEECAQALYDAIKA